MSARMMIVITNFIFLLAVTVTDGFTASVHKRHQIAAWPKLSSRSIGRKGTSYAFPPKDGADVSNTEMPGKGSDAFQRALLEARLTMETRGKANVGSSTETPEVQEASSVSGHDHSDRNTSEKIRESSQESLGDDDGNGDTKKVDASDSTPPQEITETVIVKSSSDKKMEKRKQIRSEGGIFSFDTKFGALNPFAIYYGLLSIALGMIWFAALSLCDIFYVLTGSRFDALRRLPVFINHTWGTLLMRFSKSYPEMENRDVLMDFYKQNRAAMFVANHNSWMDIPFMGATIGWRNYKIVAKKELEKVPILGQAIKCAKNVLVDRTNRRSQLFTLKSGMKWLKDGVHLCTFPEGTRSRSGRVMKFKNGAFKMAHKVGAPVIPLSIVASGKVMPSSWLFPCRPSRGIAKVVVHEPIESEGKTEDELATAAREAIISGLPDDQRPKN
uniref:1-acyl-sn-glycerol-3-phosphate acyltransferase n=1 Tax=Odontella aurita TaxID=265563 RepID=A0A7S4JNW1_9STRA|mmetsp:Transcript_50319/g.151525  ORF Transcript_50319/g.151525 Transcript_50319/m.151525 type:complete len:443 (+) Transcript_50319:126-1454(+)